jgi:hypothetical protein
LIQLLSAALEHPENAEGYIRQVIEQLGHFPPTEATQRKYFCSCGGALTAEEYIEHYFERGHDRGEGAQHAYVHEDELPADTTALETFIYNYEPGDNDREWRNRLAGVIIAAKRELAEKVLAAIASVNTSDRFPIRRHGPSAQATTKQQIREAVEQVFTESGVAVEKER